MRHIIKDSLSPIPLNSICSETETYQNTIYMDHQVHTCILNAADITFPKGNLNFPGVSLLLIPVGMDHLLPPSPLSIRLPMSYTGNGSVERTRQINSLKLGVYIPL